MGSNSKRKKTAPKWPREAFREGLRGKGREGGEKTDASQRSLMGKVPEREEHRMGIKTHHFGTTSIALRV